MKVIFLGTPLIGSKVLQALIDLKYEIIGVVCQPDREYDRKKQVIYSPVKQLALKHGFKIFQPNKIKEITSEIQALNPDLIITCAFGQFVNKEILAIPKYKCLNVHASLLPKLRGGAPIHWAVINQEKQSGVCLMEMVSKMDAGDVYCSYATNLEPRETYASLYDKLMDLAYKITYEQIPNYLQNKLDPCPQDESLVTFGYNIKKEEAILNFHQTADRIDAWIRGLYNKPIAIWNYKDMNFKIHEAHVSNQSSGLEPGSVVKIDKTGLYVSTNDYDLVITKIQLPNKPIQHISQIIHGNHPFK